MLKHIYQIWIEDPLEPSMAIKNFMSGIIGHGLPYELVSTKNYFDGDARVTWISVDSVIKEMILKYQFLQKFFDTASSHNKSNILRMYLALQNPDGLYCDCDIELLSLPTLSLQGPYFIPEDPLAALLDTGAFCDNGYSSIIKLWIETLFSYIITLKSEIPYGENFKMFNHFRIGKNIYAFDASCFNHHRDID